MSDPHLVALQGIWNEMKALNGRVNETNERLERGFADVNLRIDQTNERLTQTEIRLATEIVAVHGTMVEMKDLIKGSFTSDRTRITKLERRVDVLEAERKPK